MIGLRIAKIKSFGFVLTLVLMLYGVASAFLMMILFPYYCVDYQDLIFITRCENETSVIEHFGRPPEIVYNKGDVMPQLGWKLPTRPISNKVLVYTNKSALRFYVYINVDGVVEYVYTSNS